MFLDTRYILDSKEYSVLGTEKQIEDRSNPIN